MEETFAEKMKHPHKAMSLAVFACIGVYLALRLAGWNEAAFGASCCAGAVALVQTGFLFFPRPGRAEGKAS